MSADATAISLPPFFQDHHVNGRPVLPAVEAMEWLTAHAGLGFQKNAPLTLTDIRFDKFLFLDGPEPPLAAACFTAGEGGGQSGQLTSRFQSPGKAITRTLSHAALTLGQDPPSVVPPPMDRLASLSGVITRVDVDWIYQELVPFGPAYRNIRRLLISPDGALARVASPEPLDPRKDLRLGSPYVLDAAFHAACVWCQRFCNTVAFPVAIDHRTLVRPTRLDASYTARILPVHTDAPSFVFDIFIHDDHGALREVAYGVSMRDVSGGRRTPPPGFYQPVASDPLAALSGHVSGLVLLEREAVADFAADALSEGEKARLAPMTISRGQGYLSARLALKRLSRQLSDNADPRPAQGIETLDSDGQRPQCVLPDGRMPFCSVAHDRRFTVAVASPVPVGVDVEPLSDKALGAPDLFMNVTEQALVDASSLGRAAAALRVWGVKEAAAKAMQRYLSEAWQRVRVTTIEAGTSRLMVDDGIVRIAWHALLDGHLFTLLIMERQP